MTREYAIVRPRFWIGDTGRKLREAGPEAQIVAMYLITCMSANMLGLYYLPIAVITHETGLSAEGALKGLQGACAAGFARYDAASEYVFVPEMAAHQIAESLKANDNRVKAIHKELDRHRKSPFYEHFHQRYGQAFYLLKSRQKARVSEGPSKALRSQDQEQEQEQEQEQDHSNPARGVKRTHETLPSVDQIDQDRAEQLECKLASLLGVSAPLLGEVARLVAGGRLAESAVLDAAGGPAAVGAQKPIAYFRACLADAVGGVTQFNRLLREAPPPPVSNCEVTNCTPVSALADTLLLRVEP